MTSPGLKYAYHDAVLERCDVGPQREVILHILLDPVWNPTGPHEVRVRFGGITNFDDVREFFSRLGRPAEHAALDEIEGLTVSGKDRWTLELARGGTIVIASPKVPQEQ